MSWSARADFTHHHPMHHSVHHSPPRRCRARRGICPTAPSPAQRGGSRSCLGPRRPATKAGREGRRGSPRKSPQKCLWCRVSALTLVGESVSTGRILREAAVFLLLEQVNGDLLHTTCMAVSLRKKQRRLLVLACIKPFHLCSAGLQRIATEHARLPLTSPKMKFFRSPTRHPSPPHPRR